MKLIIIDDDPLVCQGLKTIVEIGSAHENDPIQVVAIGHDGTEAIELYAVHQPDLLLLDIRMGEMDGIAAGKIIMSKDPNAKLLYLTTFLDDEYIIESLRLGAKGYLLKTKFESVLPALYAVINGQRVFGDDIVDKIPKFIDSKPSPKGNMSPLSEKEKTIVERVAEGLNNKEIAEITHFSEGTIRNYNSVILEKLNLRDRTQLAIYYYKETNG